MNIPVISMQEKEYILRCTCGARYRFQGTESELEDFLDSQTWMCEIGRHVELGKKRDYLSVVEVRDELSPKPEVEPKRDNEYTMAELREKFSGKLEHVGFGMFVDPDGNLWDYRLGENGERLYYMVR